MGHTGPGGKAASLPLSRSTRYCFCSDLMHDRGTAVVPVCPFFVAYCLTNLPCLVQVMLSWYCPHEKAVIFGFQKTDGL